MVKWSLNDKFCVTVEQGFSYVSNFLFEKEPFALMETLHCHILGRDRGVTSGGICWVHKMSLHTPDLLKPLILKQVSKFPEGGRTHRRRQGRACRADGRKASFSFSVHRSGSVCPLSSRGHKVALNEKVKAQ